MLAAEAVAAGCMDVDDGCGGSSGRSVAGSGRGLLTGQLLPPLLASIGKWAQLRSQGVHRGGGRSAADLAQHRVALEQMAVAGPPLMPRALLGPAALAAAILEDLAAAAAATPTAVAAEAVGLAGGLEGLALGATQMPAAATASGAGLLGADVAPDLADLLVWATHTGCCLLLSTQEEEEEEEEGGEGRRQQQGATLQDVVSDFAGDAEQCWGWCVAACTRLVESSPEFRTALWQAPWVQQLLPAVLPQAWGGGAPAAGRGGGWVPPSVLVSDAGVRLLLTTLSQLQRGA